jgi:hypothetical protein
MLQTSQYFWQEEKEEEKNCLLANASAGAVAAACDYDENVFRHPCKYYAASEPEAESGGVGCHLCHNVVLSSCYLWSSEELDRAAGC